MIFIFEGMDNCLKDTFIQLLRGQISPESQVLKYSNPPKNITEAEEYQKRHFADMFDLLALSLKKSKRNLILNRAHLGEFVYSPIYRGYEAHWIFDLEKEYLEDPDCSQLTRLILLIDSNNEQLKLREDGHSLSQSDETKFNDERQKFIEAFDRSLIPIKVAFNLSDYYLDDQQSTKRVNLSPILERILELK